MLLRDLDGMPPLEALGIIGVGLDEVFARMSFGPPDAEEEGAGR